MGEKDEPPQDAKAATLTQVHKTLVDFIDETRHNFSVMNSDREHDYNLFQKTNRNVTELQGTVENLTNSVNKLIEHNKQEDTRLRKLVKEEIEELKNEISPKKVIIKKVPIFSFKVLWKKILRKAS